MAGVLMCERMKFEQPLPGTGGIGRAKGPNVEWR